MKTFFLVGWILLPGLVYAEAPPDTSAIRGQAKSSFRSGHYPEALRLYRQLTRLDPDDIDALKEAMWGFWNMQSYSEAATTASRIETLEASDPDARNILTWAPQQHQKEEERLLEAKAVQATQAGHTDEAVREYHELAGRESQSITVLHEYMWSLWNAKRYDDARQVASQIQAIDPDDEQAQHVQERAAAQVLEQDISGIQKHGDELARAGLTDQAVATYRQMVTIQPGNPDVLRTLIWALFKTDQLHDAETFALQLKTLRPEETGSWNTLARMQMAANHLQASWTSYQKSLTLDPHQPQILVELAKLSLIERHFDTAIDDLNRAASEDPLQKDLYRLLGKAYFYSDHFAQAQGAWTKAVAQHPTDAELHFNEDQARYYAGDPNGAIIDLQSLYATTKNLHALMFVIDDHIARQDTRSAEALIESALTNLHPSDEGLAMKLAALYQTDTDNDALERLLNRFLTVWPDHQSSLSMKGSLLYDEKRYRESLQVYEDLHHINPYSIAALEGLVSVHQALVHPGEALQSAELLLKLDPTEPQFINLYADALYQAGYHALAKQTIQRWLKDNHTEPVLPVVLYHDLTPFSRDPALAYPYHHTVAAFDRQMKAIHDDGYTPVTMVQVNQWLAGKASLPEKPIVIAFDDNRRCSFKYADPILAKYHLRATMFVALVNVDYHHPAAFVSWDELRHYQSTGRWELQSHGDVAHLFVPSTPAGGQGLFLVNREWLPSKNRWESLDDWRARIRVDHESAIQKMRQELGRTPSAYAWPEGLFGQDGNSNAPDAFPVNQHLVLRSFASAWTQDHVGINVRTKNPGHMTRLIPTNTWTGTQLLTHFHQHDPVTLAYSKLLDWATWEGRTTEAYQWLHALQERHVTDDVLLKEEAEIRFTAGDFSGGLALAQRATSFGDDPEVQKMIRTYAMKSGPQWSPGFTYISDNRLRMARAFDQTLMIPGVHNIQWRLAHAYGHYTEPGVTSVSDNALGAGLDARLNLVHSVSIDVMGHALAGVDHHDQVTALVRVQSRWSDTLDSEFEAGRSLYPTARALDSNLWTRYLMGTGHWNDNAWDFTLRSNGTLLSDDNRRVLAQAVASRALDVDQEWKLVYRFTFDDTKFISPSYYSPQQLRLHELGPEYNVTLFRDVDFYARYLPGIGTERIVSSQFSQDLHTYLRIRFSVATSLTPSFEYQRTPTYYETVYQLEFRHAF